MGAVRAALLGLGRACGDCHEQALCFAADELGRRACVMLALAGAPHQMRQAGVEVTGGNRAFTAKKCYPSAQFAGERIPLLDWRHLRGTGLQPEAVIRFTNFSGRAR